MLKRIVVGGAIAGAGLAAYRAVRQWWATWGIDPAEAARPLPGDDLVPDALTSDTRGITIDAPPERIWPWLVQMGYGRAGWYSIDALDMRGKSADRIVPEWQGLEVGEVVPTHPDGGFTAKVVEPNRALVLYVDTASVRPLATTDATGSSVPVGLQASGRFLAQTPQEFAASWAFVLEPLGPGRTRLIERVRYWGAETNGLSSAALGLLGFGVFVMTQRQMTGVRERAEREMVEHPDPTSTAAQPA